MSISNLRRSLIFRRRLLGDNDSTTASYQSRSGRTAVPALLEIEYTEESSQVTLTSVEDGTTEDRLELEMENDYASMLKGLRASFGSGRTKTLEWRVRQLQGLIRMYDENTSAFVMALHKDLRKPRMEALGSEVDFLKNDALSCLRDIKEWMAPRPARKNTVSLLDRVETRPEPYGVALIIGAWNYPLHLTLAPLSGAIAAGNCAVVKPSEISPHTAKAVEELLPKYLDPLCFKVKKIWENVISKLLFTLEFVQVVNGGVPETTELLKQRFDYIFYTGSTGVGKIIAKAAAVHLTPCTLELGGKSPVYVSDGCPQMDMVAKRLLWGKCINAGQVRIQHRTIQLSPPHPFQGVVRKYSA